MPKNNRRCGGCTMCCRLPPVEELNKPANVKCRHARAGHGCMIYRARPVGCQLWVCGWLLGAAVDRPDRAGYVIDPLVPADVIVDGRPIKAITVWVSPARPEAWRHDKKLRRLMEAQAMPFIIRHGNEHGILIIPPSAMKKLGWENADEWFEQDEKTIDKETFDALLQTARATLG